MPEGTLVLLLSQHTTGGKEKRKKSANVASRAKQKLAPLPGLMNRADGWPPLVPHPYENPLPSLVCQSLSHSLPASELVSHCALHSRFSSLADSATHSPEVSQARASPHQPVCLSPPFICCLLSIHTQGAHSPCQTICMFCKR